MARLKSASTAGSGSPLLEHFRVSAQAHVARMATAKPTELVPHPSVFVAHAQKRLRAIERGEPFVVGRYELPRGTRVPRLADSYVLHADGRLTPFDGGLPT